MSRTNCITVPLGLRLALWRSRAFGRLLLLVGVVVCLISGPVCFGQHPPRHVNGGGGRFSHKRRAIYLRTLRESPHDQVLQLWRHRLMPMYR